MLRISFISLCLIVLSSCSPSTPEWHAKAQFWQDFHIHYETRPTTLRQGMNEFLIFIERKKQKHIPDLLVHIQIDHDALQQAMPDGALGIYRRALFVHDAQHNKLHVHLSYHGQKGEVIFDLVPHASTATAH